MNSSVVRVTSGKFRGQTLNTPGKMTHPMGSRERLALFNMLTPYLANAKILDTKLPHCPYLPQMLFQNYF